MKEQIIGYKVSCTLCGKKLTDISDEKLKKKLVKHVDNECKAAKDMKSWEEKGIFNEMMKLIRLEAISKDIKKLLKKYTIEEIRNALLDIEIGETKRKKKKQKSYSSGFLKIGLIRSIRLPKKSVGHKYQ